MGLSKDYFSKVEVDGGKVVNLGSSYFAAGYAAPGIAKRLELEKCELTEEIDLNEVVEITGKCKDFQLDYTATIFTNGLFGEIKAADIKDLEKAGKKSDKLEDAVKKLVDGGSDLYSGAEDFQKYLDQYINGAASITQGTSQLKQGLQTLNANQKSLLDGAAAMEDGLGKMNEALKNLDTDAITKALADNPQLAFFKAEKHAIVAHVN